jgi:3',5'-cyclic AMP phosphodiesterase CpdA
MKTVIQLSDLHFGRVDPVIVDALSAFVSSAAPDLLVVSGDLTQRATQREFLEAQEFLKSFDMHKVIVPGNHDVPLFDIWRRFSRPYERFMNMVDPSIEPFHLDDEMAVLGVNTSRSLAWKEGRLNLRQLESIARKMKEVEGNRVKIVVTHHPLERVKSVPGSIIGHTPHALHALLESRIDLFLAGHLHTGRNVTVSRKLKDGEHSAILVRAGTATSFRYRGEPNSFNVIRVAKMLIKVETYSWDAEMGGFKASEPEVFARTKAGWVKK